MSNHQIDQFDEISDLDLAQVGGGTRSVTSPSSSSQTASLKKLESEVQGMQGGGADMQFMMMIMQMMQKKSGSGSEVSSVHSPGLLGALIGGTTTMGP